MANTNFKSLINVPQPVVIDFHADWCGPCKVQGPIIKELKTTLGDQIKVIKIDIDRNPALANKLGIKSIPTIMIYQDGALQWQASGVQTLAVLKTQVGKLLP